MPDLRLDLEMTPAKFPSWQWFKDHAAHFAISTAVSIAVSFAANPVLHHMGVILHFFHVPVNIIHWLGY
jgi:hypothetical protein